MGSVGDCYDNARRTTPAWLFDTQTEFIFPMLDCPPNRGKLRNS